MQLGKFYIIWYEILQKIDIGCCAHKPYKSKGLLKQGKIILHTIKMVVFEQTFNLILLIEESLLAILELLYLKLRALQQQTTKRSLIN